MLVIIDLVAEPLDVLISLGPKRSGDHPPGALPSQLIERERDLLVALPAGSMRTFVIGVPSFPAFRRSVLINREGTPPFFSTPSTTFGYSPNFHELEYFVALERGPDALAAMRELMLRSLPDSLYPMEVRTVGPEDAYLSPNYGTATVVISVSGKPGTDYWDYLRSVDALLSQFDARVHWGKLHFLTPERLHALYPEADEFIAIRRELDPDGAFLNDHLRALFA